MPELRKLVPANYLYISPVNISMNEHATKKVKNPSGCQSAAEGFSLFFRCTGISSMTLARATRRTRLVDRVGSLGEHAAGVLADRGDRREANAHDQREHHGVFDRGGAVFRNQKPTQLGGKRFHHFSPFRSARRLRNKTLIKLI
jgi:hypothetical protein